MEFKDALTALVEQIRSMVETMISSAKFDKTYKGTVTTVTALDNGKYKYQITINGTPRTMKSSTSYEVGDYVYVLVPCNTWNDAFILK